MGQSISRGFSRVLRSILLGIAAAVFLIEDLLIRRIGRLLGLLAALSPVARMEAWAARQSPFVSLILLVVTVAFIYPIHFLAIPCFLAGQWMRGLAILVFAKLTAAGVIGRILHVCHPRLMELRWFRALDAWVRATRARIMDAVRNTAFWQSYQRLKLRFKGSGRFGRWLRGLRRAVAPGPQNG